LRAAVLRLAVSALMALARRLAQRRGSAQHTRSLSLFTASTTQGNIVRLLVNFTLQ
jgi:hypothetical protein